LKGYYYEFLNLSYPEQYKLVNFLFFYFKRIKLKSHVSCFSTGGTCNLCNRRIEEEWIKNINLLSLGFSIKIDFLKGRFINFKLFYCLEIEDSPERALSVMSKNVTANFGCSECKIHKVDYLDIEKFNLIEYYPKLSKTLQDAKIFYKKAEEDFKKTGNTKHTISIEEDTGYKFSEKIGKVSKLVQPSTFFDLNEIEKLDIPSEPFHSIIRCFIKNIIKNIVKGFTENEIQQSNLILKEISFPKRMKKVSSIKTLGENDDALIALIYVFPFMVENILEPNIFELIKFIFDDLIILLNPGYFYLFI
jgi:hypothetical protein